VAFYLTLIALLNMGAGFAAAVYLGRKSRASAAWRTPRGPSESEPKSPHPPPDAKTVSLSGNDCPPAAPAPEEERGLPPRAAAPPTDGGEQPTEEPAEFHGFLERAAFDAELDRRWPSDPDRPPQLTVAMIDLDRFSQVNEGFGREAGNRVLGAIAGMIAEDCRGQAVPARFSGQRFAILFSGPDPQVAASFVERVRQTVEAAQFQYEDRSIQVTLSCGIASAAAGDAPAAVLERTEAALVEAKRYGRNRTFAHDGKRPTPVVPPDLGIEERTIAL
jgi:diguanylate cyclase (GGDEF)-like protein